MNNQIIVCFIVALLLGMLLDNMLKNVCGCKLTEGQGDDMPSEEPLAEQLRLANLNNMYAEMELDEETRRNAILARFAEKQEAEQQRAMLRSDFYAEPGAQFHAPQFAPPNS